MLRIGIVGAASLLGRELDTALRERRFPALAPRLLGVTAQDSTGARGLIRFGDEAAVLEPLVREQVEDLDVLFLAGSAEESARAWELAQGGSGLVVDLTATLGTVAGAVVAGLEGAAGKDAEKSGTRLLVVAHPAAQALALLMQRLAHAGTVSSASATVFEPASERGMAGVQELEQQTVRLLALQALPQAVYDAQVAFNLRASLGEEAQPSLEQVRRRIAAEGAALGGAATAKLAVQLLQAPLFHACVISLYVRYTAAPSREAVEASLASPWLAASGEEPPDAVGAAGEEAIQRGPVRADAAGGFWIFATLDNLRRTAFSAVDAAAEARA